MAKTKLCAFRKWLHANGGYIHPAAELVYSEASGVHLLVTTASDHDRTIAPGSAVISVPHTLSLSALNTISQLTSFPSDISRASASASPQIPAALLSNVPRAQSLAAIWLCVHQQCGVDSFWAPYIDALPSIPSVSGTDATKHQGLGEIDSPLGWSAEEKAWFSGSPLEKGTADLENMWYSEWMQWGMHAASWAEESGLRIDWPLYKWALSLLTSRAFSSAVLDHVVHGDRRLTALFNPDALLYPGMDMLNHSPTTKNRWEYDQDSFTLVCNDNLHNGDEIFNTYGAKNNGQLMLCYAFTIPQNPYDAFPLKVPPANNMLETLVNQQHNASSVDPESSPPHGTKTTNKPAVVADPHDPAQTTFYVRNPGIDIPRPGYPATSSCFAPFPIALLNRLSSTLASSRERHWATEHAEFIRNSASDLLHPHLGQRNNLALASLLFDRLRFEAARLDSTLSSIPPVSTSRAVDPSSRHESRRTLAHAYISDLHDLLCAAEKHMRDSLRRTLRASHEVYMTLDAALSELPGEILASMGAGLGTDLTSSEPDTLRRAVAVWTAAGLAEDIWAVYLGVLESTSKRGIALGRASERYAAWMAHLTPQIPAAADEQGMEADDVVRHFWGFLAEGKGRAGENDAGGPIGVWSGEGWTDETVRRCCWIVQNESVSVAGGCGLWHGEGSVSTGDARKVVLVIDVAYGEEGALGLS